MAEVGRTAGLRALLEWQVNGVVESKWEAIQPGTLGKALPHIGVPGPPVRQPVRAWLDDGSMLQAHGHSCRDQVWLQLLRDLGYVRRVVIHQRQSLQ